jgi:hypothetical protein
MKILVRTTSPRRALQRVQRALFAGVLLILGYCGLAVVNVWLFQHREGQNLERLSPDERAPKNGYLEIRLPGAFGSPP